MGNDVSGVKPAAKIGSLHKSNRQRQSADSGK